MLHPVPKPQKRVKIKKRLKARREPKAFQHRRVPDYQEFIRSYACLFNRRGAFPCRGLGILGSECAHVKSRDAGGDDIGNCVPLCHAHHEEQHRIGIRSFQQRYGVDLYAIAADLGRIYQARARQSGVTLARIAGRSSRSAKN